jgi:hypothetical protein
MLPRSRYLTIPAVCALAAACAAGRPGPSTPVNARSADALLAADRVLRNEGIPVRDRIGRRDATRLRSFAFDPARIWSAQQVTERVVCTSKQGESVQPEGRLWLFVEVSARPVQRISWSGIPQSAMTPTRLPTTLVGLSYDGRVDTPDGRARCVLSEEYARTLLHAIVASMPPAMLGGS